MIRNLPVENSRRDHGIDKEHESPDTGVIPEKHGQPASKVRKYGKNEKNPRGRHTGRSHVFARPFGVANLIDARMEEYEAQKDSRHHRTV